MARINRSKKGDPQIEQILDLFAGYESTHPNALIEARRGRYSFIYLRIMDTDFEGIDELEREQEVWAHLEQLPNEILRKLSLLVLVTPQEALDSGSSLEFDDPLPEEPLSWQMPDEMALSTDVEALNGAISVPLEASEVEALEQVAQREGLSHSALIRQWVQEKLASFSLLGKFTRGTVGGD